jgi:CBS-domain-containing membrane protein
MRTVEQVMVRKVVTVQPQAAFKQVVRLLRERRVSAAPVVDEQGRLLGMVSEADLALKEEHTPAQPPPLLPRPGLRREQRKAAATTVADCMTTPAVAIHPQAPLGVAARLLHRRGVRHLPVVDADDRLVGIVTRRDLLGVFLRSDEELRREVAHRVLGDILRLPVQELRVTVREGVVVLEGQVEQHSQAERAARLVGALDGVVAVDSRLGWEVDDLRPLTPAYHWGPDPAVLRR